MGLRIGELSKRTGVSVEALRYYERVGLLPTPPRTDSGYRTYPVGSVDRILFVRRAKSLGFMLEEIQSLLSLQDATNRHADVRQLARHRLTDIEKRIADLERMRAALSELICQCEHEAPTAPCPIIEALSGAAPRADSLNGAES